MFTPNLNFVCKHKKRYAIILLSWSLVAIMRAMDSFKTEECIYAVSSIYISVYGHISQVFAAYHQAMRNICTSDDFILR